MERKLNGNKRREAEVEKDQNLKRNRYPTLLDKAMVIVIVTDVAIKSICRTKKTVFFYLSSLPHPTLAESFAFPPILPIQEE